MTNPATRQEPAGVLLLFIDGIGLDDVSPHNPFAPGAMPFLEDEIGGPLTRETIARAVSRTGRTFGAIDATLGVDGLPQSATGQTALFTGVNAPEALGRHVTAFPGKRLREILNRASVFRRVTEDGGSTTFANAFSPRYYELLSERRLKKSASVFATEAAGIELRSLEQLRSGQAVSWDVVGDLLSTGLDDPDPGSLLMPPTEAGANLARMVLEHDLTLYETFLPDLAGHRRLELSSEAIVGRLDGLLSGLLSELESKDRRFTVVVSSDHGNFENLSHRRHTRNPVPLLVFGDGHDRFERVTSLIDLAEVLFSLSRHRA